MQRFLAKIVLAMQLSAAMAAFVALALWPPAHGRLLLVSLSDRQLGDEITAAIAGGGVLLGRGPVTGSVVISGDRSTIARQFIGWDVIIVAAPPTGCGSPDVTA